MPSVASIFLRSLFCLVTLIALATSRDTRGEEILLAKPNAKQLQFADWEVGAFIHYGLNVYTGQEHGDGKPSPAEFNPTALDAEQWVLAAKALGAKYACLTARHEGGFCLWPSKTTDYTIANSPYKGGKGDLVREFVDACRKHDIIPALYHTSSHDAHHQLPGYEGNIPWGRGRDDLVDEAYKDRAHYERYKQIQLDQMRELLTNYGPIGFMWSDHWMAPNRHETWLAITELVEELQPEMVFMGPDTWVPGNETGHVVYPMWNAVNTQDGTRLTRPAASASDTSAKNDYGLLETDVLTGHPLGKFWRVRECTTNTGFHHGGWFWHPGKTRAKSLREHIDLYYRTVGLGANTIINLPPDNRGLVPDDIVAAAEAFGKEIHRRFASPVAELHEVTAGDTVEVAWETPRRIDTVVSMENIANGQKVAAYTLEAFVDGEWQALEPANKLMSRKPYNNRPGYQTIGHKKIDRVAPVVTNRVRFRCLASVTEPVEIRRLSVFNCHPE